MIEKFTDLNNNNESLKLELNKEGEKSLLLINLSCLERINRNYGINIGDKLIMEFSLFLSQYISKNAIFYRISGNIFAVLLFNSNEIEAVNFAEQMLGYYSTNDLNIEEFDIRMSLNIGIATGDNESILADCHYALLELQYMGKNQYFVFKKDSPLQKKIEQNIIWQKKLKHSLENSHIIPYFQPIYNVKTNKIEKYEALVRIDNGEEIVTPFAFLDAAKDTGLLSALTRIVIHQSLKIFANNKYDISLNITGDDLNDIRFTSFIQHKINTFQIEPSRLYFEILEGINSDMNDRAFTTIHNLKQLGCNISIDDFGSEYSNFSRILKMAVDVIKIDGSFVKKIVTDEKSKKIVFAMVQFSHSIGAKTVAEFVSSKEIFDAVKKLGVDYVQGYYIGEPLAKLK